MNWEAAKSYCDNLDLGGHTDWRLPTISELRTLIRGCPETMTGGACGVTDSCLNGNCWSDSCSGCDYLAGPDSGCYWDPALSGECKFLGYWSLSSGAGNESTAWRVYFDNGSSDSNRKASYSYHARCVRSGP